MKYIKKPVEVEAILFDGTNAEALHDWALKFVSDGDYKKITVARDRYEGDYMYIDTPEGKMICRKGDYIIKGVKNEFYPCKPDIFEMTYEAVNEQKPT